MVKTERKCPECGSSELVCERLGTKGSAWPVMFGSVLFKKKGLDAYACKRCQYVFLYLGDGTNDGTPSD